MDKYYWINRAAKRLIKRMEVFGDRESLQGSLFGNPQPTFLMKKLKTLRSIDGNRDYEFLIEFDTYNPSQGIYFGCKSLTLSSRRHSSNIRKAMEDWEAIRPHAVRRLNNTFPGVDFSLRFKDTDNANDNTFWPFWISVHDDEDLKGFIWKALTIIADCYSDFIEGRLDSENSLPELLKTPSGKTSIECAFTAESYDNLKSQFKRNCLQRLDSSRRSDVEVAWSIFEELISKLAEENVFSKLTDYECAWSVQGRYSVIEFNCIMRIFFQRLSVFLETDNIKVPWQALSRVFMDADRQPFKPQLRTLNPIGPNRLKWQKRLSTVFSKFEK